MDNLDYIIGELIKEQKKYTSISIPDDIDEKRRLMRSLLNIRPPAPISEDFLKAQDIELNKQLTEKGIIDANQIQSSVLDSRLKLWQGDITRLKIDAIVNAANSQMLGCFSPLHGCIDNAIHSAAGIQLRLECYEIMKKQGFEEPTGSAKITNAYNLPSKYVIHTVGPVIRDETATPEEEKLLADCYQSCLKIAEEHQIKSIAFCCISTGEYRFPNLMAARIAVNTVLSYLNNRPSTTIETIIFNVFKKVDFSIYEELLQSRKR